MIRIECTGADMLSLDAIEDFQKDLKCRTDKDIELIVKSIETYGFSFPFFIWRNAGHNFCLDGHGRIRALTEMRKRGDDLPMFPVVYIEADDEGEAKKKLLEVNASYGKMTVESVVTFLGDTKMEIADLNLVMDDGIGFEKTITTERPFKRIHFFISLPIARAEDVRKEIEAIKSKGIEVLTGEN
jgi:hypothetical protein